MPEPIRILLESKQRRTRSAAAQAADAAQRQQWQQEAEAQFAENARRLFRLITERRATWKTCRLTDCRRRRACTAQDFQCSNMPLPPLTPEQKAAALALLKNSFGRGLRALVRRMAE